MYFFVTTIAAPILFMWAMGGKKGLWSNSVNTEEEVGKQFPDGCLDILSFVLSIPGMFSLPFIPLLPPPEKLPDFLLTSHLANCPSVFSGTICM